MTRLIPFVAATMIMFGTHAARAQETGSLAEEINASSIMRSFLLSDAPMGMSVTITEKQTGDLGLTKETVENAVESRLRAARLFTKDSSSEGLGQYLNVAITGVGPAFGLVLRLKRQLTDTGFDLPGVVSIWETSSVGTHGGDGHYILGALSEYLDEFLAKYLRVNEEACAKK